jgi:arginyl-tRNA synthetase
MNNLEETGYIIIDNSVEIDKTLIDKGQNGLNIDQLLEKINSLFDHKILELTKTVDEFALQFEKTSYSITNEFNRIPEKTASITSGLISQIEKSLGRINTDFSDLSNKSNSLYNQELIEVLTEMKTTLNSLNPALEALSKPTEITLTSSKKQL